MRRPFAVAVSLLIMNVAAAFADCSNCGPDFCQSDARVPQALAAKKRTLAATYPARLVALLDIGDQCYARITRAPDGFTMWIVRRDGSKFTTPWTEEDENIAKRQIGTGEVKRYWIFNAQRAFSCCGQAPYQQRSDYDREDDVSAATAIKCEQGAGGAGVRCTR